MDEAQGTLLAMALGFGAAAIVIVGAFFVEPVARAGRVIAMVVARVAIGAIGRAVVAAGGGTAGAARGLLALPAQLMARISTAAAERAARVRTAASAPSADPAVDVDVADDEAEDAYVPLAPPPVDERRPKSLQDVGSRRTFTPASSLHVDEQARELLLSRGGFAPVEAVVRHLDQTFGAGMGQSLLESLRKRRLVVVRRDPARPTRILVFLREGHPQAEHDGR